MNNVGAWKLYVFCVINVIKSIDKHSFLHLTPNFFFAQINFHIMWSKSPPKFFDLLESSIFYRWSKYGKFNKNAAILVHVRVLGAWD